jgi:hypothetical protein
MHLERELEVVHTYCPQQEWARIQNLESMTRATKAQLLIQVVRAMTSKEINLTFPLKMGRATW